MADLRARGQKVQVIDGIMWLAAFVFFFLFGVIGDLDYAWIALLAPVGAMMITRTLLKFDEAEEKTFESLKKQEAKEKQKRLLAAEKRVRELGK